MKRVLLGCGGVIGLLAAALGAGVWAGPAGLAWALGTRGVTTASVAWCDGGLCLDGLTRGDATVARVHVGWDRVARAEGVVVPLETALSYAREAGGVDVVGGEATDDAGGVDVVAWGKRLVVAVHVASLTVPGAPLPALSGQVWPERRLTGEGVTVEGDTVRLDVPSPVGALAVSATREADGIALVATCAACVLPAPGPADVPLALPAVTARGTWTDGAFRGTVSVGDVEARVAARPDAGGAVADLTLPETPLAAVYTLFGAWVPEVRRARIGGTLALTARVRWRPGDGAPADPAAPDDSPDPDAPDDAPTGVLPAGFSVDTFEPVLAAFTVEGLVPDALAGGRFSFRARGPGGDEAEFVRGEGTPEWVPLAEMGVWLPAAVIAAEDGAFRAHRGYDLAGMRSAADHNGDIGKIARGGSTLTQQLAKNLFLDGTRSYARKLRELLYAVEMESELGKARILTIYLNSVEFGPGIRGVRAAADTYFLKTPAALLPEEAAWLASILRYPKTAYTRQFLGGAVDMSRVRFVLQNMADVPEDARTSAIDRPVRLLPP